MIYLEQLFSNKMIGIAIVSWAIAQIIKMIIDFTQSKKVDWELVMSSGGMPSSHTSFVTSLAFSIGYEYGFDSIYFAICFVLCMIVMYDAAGIRRAAGNQAIILNKILDNVDKYGIKVDEKLKELLGHTPIEVGAGALLGFVVATIFKFLI